MLFLLVTLTAFLTGYALFMLGTFISCWWCLTAQKRVRKYSLFAVLWLVLVIVHNGAALVFFLFHADCCVIPELNGRAVSMYCVAVLRLALEVLGLQIIRYYRNHQLYKAGALPRWIG